MSTIPRETTKRSWRIPLLILLLGTLFALAGTTIGGVREPFPENRPTTRAEAEALVTGQLATANCLTPRIQALGKPPFGSSPTVRRALALLRHRPFAATQSIRSGPEDSRVFYTTRADAFDRIAPADHDGDGEPDLLEQVLYGLDQAHALLVERLGMNAPPALDVVLLELGPDLRGYLVPVEPHASQATLVLDASPGSDADATRREAIHQYAHAVALAASPRFPRAWAEALANWATMTVDGGPDDAMIARLSENIDRLGAGLDSADPNLMAGKALWLAFVEHAYGPVAVRLTVQELASSTDVVSALGRAVGRVSGDDLAAAFREFHLWTILVGPLADRHHFPFARRLEATNFASVTEGLPALSVQADPGVAPWGAAQVRILPEYRDGGLSIRFDGEFGARWEADLLLVERTGTLRRLPIELSAAGRGEVTVPLEEVAEALILIRAGGSDDDVARRYTYSAHREPGYPFDLAFLEARSVDAPDEGVLVSWETRSEQQLLGYNVLRSRREGGPEVVANPVWVPALGDAGSATSYQYLDRSADPDVAYIYRVEGITRDGLTSRSDRVMVPRPTP